MKCGIIVLITFAFSVVYAASVAKDVDLLLERGTSLVATGHKLIAEYQAKSKSHLLSALVYQVKVLEEIVSGVKKLKSHADTLGHRTTVLNEAEENLLHAENAINREMDFITEMLHYNATGKTSEELINYAEGHLLKEAKEVLASKEINQLKNEIKHVEEFVKELKKFPNLKDIKHVFAEESLAKHEKTLRAIINGIKD